MDNIMDDNLEVDFSEVHHGKNIVIFRKMKDWSQRDLATEMGITQQAVSKMERQKVLPEDTLVKVAHVLGLDVDILKKYTTSCRINVVNENEVKIGNDAKGTTINISGTTETTSGDSTTNYNAEKALEVIETVVNNQNDFLNYLKTENEFLKNEIKELRKQLLEKI